MHLLNKGGHFSLYMSLGPGIRSTRALVHKHTQMHKSCVYGPDVYAHSHVHACTQNHIRAHTNNLRTATAAHLHQRTPRDDMDADMVNMGGRPATVRRNERIPRGACNFIFCVFRISLQVQLSHEVKVQDTTPLLVRFDASSIFSDGCSISVWSGLWFRL